MSIPKRTFRESGRACSRSIGKNTEKSTWFRYQWRVSVFMRVLRASSVHQQHLWWHKGHYWHDIRPLVSQKRTKERHDIENKKLELFEQAVVTIEAPHPATGDSLAHEINAAHVWIDILQTGSIYMSESQEVHFRCTFWFRGTRWARKGQQHKLRPKFNSA